MKVRKAVITAAGFGTRMLPASKVVPKELLPVVDVPAIQLVVEEAVASGVQEIGVVVSPGRTLVLDHFRPAEGLERYLESRGRHDLLKLVRTGNQLARLTAVEQKEPLGLGHSVHSARDFVGDEPFAVLLPDDIFDAEPPCLKQLLDVADRTEAPVLALLRVPRHETSRYGMVKAEPAGERLSRLTGMAEKPRPHEAPSDLAIMGRYVLTPDIFEFLAGARPGVGGEIQLTDALLALSAGRPVYGYEFEGTRYDLGDRLGFLRAQIGFGLKRPDLAASLRAYLASVLSS